MPAVLRRITITGSSVVIAYRRSLHVNMGIIVVIAEMVRFYRRIDPLTAVNR